MNKGTQRACSARFASRAATRPYTAVVLPPLLSFALWCCRCTATTSCLATHRSLEHEMLLSLLFVFCVVVVDDIDRLISPYANCDGILIGLILVISRVRSQSCFVRSIVATRCAARYRHVSATASYFDFDVRCSMFLSTSSITFWPIHRIYLSFSVCQSFLSLRIVALRCDALRIIVAYTCRVTMFPLRNSADSAALKAARGFDVVIDVMRCKCASLSRYRFDWCCSFCYMNRE